MISWSVLYFLNWWDWMHPWASAGDWLMTEGATFALNSRALTSCRPLPKHFNNFNVGSEKDGASENISLLRGPLSSDFHSVISQGCVRDQLKCVNIRKASGSDPICLLTLGYCAVMQWPPFILQTSRDCKHILNVLEYSDYFLVVKSSIMC